MNKTATPKIQEQCSVLYLPEKMLTSSVQFRHLYLCFTSFASFLADGQDTAAVHYIWLVHKPSVNLRIS